MRIAIIDADLIGRVKHRFPNLASEKISGYFKDHGHDVELKLDYENLDEFDHVYISKVFTDTPCPILDALSKPKGQLKLFTENTLSLKNVSFGGTGFYFDKAPDLSYEIEHHKPDYTLYDNWIQNEVNRAENTAKASGKKFDKTSFMVQFKEYTSYSIGFLTRGCFRKCPFCVNQKYSHVFEHSPLEEFLDSSRKKICLLDDNFLGYPKWKSLLQTLIDSKKPFKFKQGLDERILTDEKCEMLFNSNYDGDWTFAFDNVKDYDLIHKQLKLIRRWTQTQRIKFYVLCGFESVDERDIANTFKRIELLLRYRCLPYIMRYQNKNETPWKESRFSHLYVTIARWCNQPNMVKKKSFREFCEANQKLHRTEGTLCSAMQSMIDFEKEFPDIADQYFDMRFNQDCTYDL